MRIYCDIDDVLSRTAEALLKLAADEFGRVLAYDEVTNFNLQLTFNFTDEEMRRFSVLSHAYDNLIAYEPESGAVAGVKALAAKGHLVEFVTGRPATAHRATADWLERVGLGGFRVRYVDKYGRPCPQGDDLPRTLSPTEFAAIPYDLAIDDSPLALDALRHRPETKVIVFDRPWNRAYPLAPNMVRIAGWSGLCGIADFMV